MNFKKISALTALLISLPATIILAEPKIDLTEGTLFLSGSLAFQYDVIGFTDAQHIFGLSSDVGGGYFVLDNLAVGLSIPTSWRFTPNNGGSVGLKIFSTYFFDIKSIVFPYAGLSVTPGYDISGRWFQLLAGIHGGVLLSLTESVGLDFGIRPEVSFKLTDKQKWRLSIPAGFIGVSAFF